MKNILCVICNQKMISTHSSGLNLLCKTPTDHHCHLNLVSNYWYVRYTSNIISCSLKSAPTHCYFMIFDSNGLILGEWQAPLVPFENSYDCIKEQIKRFQKLKVFS